MKKITMILLSTACSFMLLQAQTYNSWQNYTFSQRVSGINVVGDYIWISTQGGLVRYNKLNGEKTFYNRANSNLPDNNLLSIYCNSNDEIWVGSKYYGVGKFNGEESTNFNQSNSGLPNDHYNTQIKEDKYGNVWMISYYWIAKYDGVNWKEWSTGSSFSSFPLVTGFDIDENGVVWVFSTDGIAKIENDIYSIVSTIGSGLIGKSGCVKIDSEQNVWIAIHNIGLYKYNGTTFTLYSTSNSCLPTNNISDISFDTQNIMWLATPEGLVKFDISDCKVYTPSLPDKALLRIQTDQNNIVWCGTVSGNMLLFNGVDFTSIDLSNSPLKNNYVSDILVENDNHLWIGTKNNTVNKTNDQFLSKFNKGASAFAQDKNGAVWMAFSSGDTSLIKIGIENSTVFDSINSPFSTHKVMINCLGVDDYNNLWIGTKGRGLYKYDGITFTNFNTANSTIPSNEITELAFDNLNNLWGGSVNGLFKYSGSAFTVWNKTNSSIPTNVVIGLAIDSENKLWFSCMDEGRIIGKAYGGGLTCFDGQTMNTYKTSNSGLLTNTVFGVCVDSNDMVWLATYGGGLMSFDKTDKWTSYNVTNSGIANNFVQRIRQDKSGTFWLGHIDAGISVFNPGSFQSSLNQIDKSNASLVLFPNPIKDDLYVKLNINSPEIIQASIFDLTGKLICTLPNQAIDQDNSIIHYRIQNLLQNNQIYVLQINWGTDQLSAKFFVEKK